MGHRFIEPTSLSIVYHCGVLLGLHSNSTEGFFLKNLCCSECRPLLIFEGVEIFFKHNNSYQSEGRKYQHGGHLVFLQIVDPIV